MNDVTEEYDVDCWKGELRLAALELITLEEGWLDLSRGYFCKIEREGVCVEDFGMTRRSALRYARKAWRKQVQKKHTLEHGYPKVRDCDS